MNFYSYSTEWNTFEFVSIHVDPTDTPVIVPVTAPYLPSYFYFSPVLAFIGHKSEMSNRRVNVGKFMLN